MLDVIKYPVAWRGQFDARHEMALMEEAKNAGDKLNKSLDEGYVLISTIPVVLEDRAYIVYTLHKKPIAADPDV